MADGAVSFDSPTREVLDLGCTEIWQGDDPVADIIFVHGLNGHPKRTWTSQTKPQPNTSKKSVPGRLWPWSGGAVVKDSDGRAITQSYPGPVASDTYTSAESTEVFWPAELLPHDIPNTRIITYGYDSDVHVFLDRLSQSSISPQSRRLLDDLGRLRQDNPGRPIIFIAHSLGGIVVKDALRRSRVAPEFDFDLRQVYASTFAIVFFGTPHQGSPSISWNKVVGNIALATGFEQSRLLTQTTTSSTPDTIDAIQAGFNDMQDDGAFKTFYFQESLPDNLLGGKVVENTSTSAGNSKEVIESIHADHMNMCKFTGPNDLGYVKVKHVLMNYIKEIMTMRREKKPSLLNDGYLQELSYPEMSDPWQSISEAEPLTFDWLFLDERTGFDSWLRDGRGIYWITGKPGSGKSTIMKFALKNPRTLTALHIGNPTKNLALCGVFLNSRGVRIQNSYEGVLRSILFQISAQIPALGPFLGRAISPSAHKLSWDIPSLERALSILTEQREISGQVCLFIDALDEYSETNTHIAGFVEKLVRARPGSGLSIKTCVSSRAFEVFQMAFGQCPKILIHEWTRKDIFVYVTNKLLTTGSQDLVQLREAICDRAAGVFLWVILVVRGLLQGYHDGGSRRELLSVLEVVPPELEELYTQVLDRIPQRYKQETYLMLKIVLSASLKPLTLMEFTLAFQLSQRRAERSFLNEWESEEQIARRIKSRCGGILEVQEWSEPSSGDIRIATLSTDTSIVPLPGNSSFPEGKLQFSKVHFTHLTAREFFQHSESYGSLFNIQDVVDGPALIFDLYSYLLSHPDPLSRYMESQQLGFAQLHATDLINSLLFYGAAAEKSSGTAQTKFLDQVDRYLTTLPHDDESKCKWFENWYGNQKFLDPLGPEGETSFLAFALCAGLVRYAKDVISTPEFNVNLEPGWPTLIYAVAPPEMRSLPFSLYKQESRARYDFTRWLLAEGADPNALSTVADCQYINNIRESPLSLALSRLVSGRFTGSTSDQLELIQLLADCGADPNKECMWNYWKSEEVHITGRGSPLHALLYTWSGIFEPIMTSELDSLFSRLIKTLISKGADAAALDNAGVGTLEIALPFCDYSIVEYLLSKGAKITEKMVTNPEGLFRGAGGILREPRFRQPQFHTLEAIPIALSLNPQWNQGWLGSIVSYTPDSALNRKELDSSDSMPPPDFISRTSHEMPELQSLESVMLEEKLFSILGFDNVFQTEGVLSEISDCVLGLDSWRFARRSLTTPGIRSLLSTVVNIRACFTRLVEALYHLRSIQFCSGDFSLLVRDPRRPDVASVITVPATQVIPFEITCGELIKEIEKLDRNPSSHSSLNATDEGLSEILILFQWLAEMNRRTLELIGLNQTSPLSICQPEQSLQISDIALVTLEDSSFLAMVLSVGLLSYGGSHVGPFDQSFFGKDIESLEMLRSGNTVSFQKLPLACLAGFINGPVWVLSNAFYLSKEKLRLSISCYPNEFADLWGPIRTKRTGADAKLLAQIDVSGGCLRCVDDYLASFIQVNPDEMRCHWFPTGSLKEEDIPTLEFRFYQRLLIGAARLDLNTYCTQRQRSHDTKPFGTEESRFYLDSMTFGLTGGGSMGGTFSGIVSGTVKKRPVITRKQEILDDWAAANKYPRPWFLDQETGLEVSLCTYNARRRTLYQLLGCETVQKYLRKTLEGSNGTTWSSAAGQAFQKALRSSSFTEFELSWAIDAYREKFIDYIRHALRLLAKTGVDRSGNLKCLYLPAANREPELLVLPHDPHQWVRMVEDTVPVCTWSVATTDCLELRDVSEDLWKCWGRRCLDAQINLLRPVFQTRVEVDVGLDMLASMAGHDLVLPSSEHDSPQHPSSLGTPLNSGSAQVVNDASPTASELPVRPPSKPLQAGSVVNFSRPIIGQKHHQFLNQAKTPSPSAADTTILLRQRIDEFYSATPNKAFQLRNEYLAGEPSKPDIAVSGCLGPSAGSSAGGTQHSFSLDPSEGLPLRTVQPNIAASRPATTTPFSARQAGKRISTTQELKEFDLGPNGRLRQVMMREGALYMKWDRPWDQSARSLLNGARTRLGHFPRGPRNSEVMDLAATQRRGNQPINVIVVQE